MADEMMSPDLESAAAAGARQIISICLGLTRGQELLTFLDETTLDAARILAEAANELGVHHTMIFVPVAMQRRIPKESPLSLLTQGAANDARAILTCVNGTPECLPFRKHLLLDRRTAHTRVGHMPGADAKVLTLANADFGRLVSDCKMLELAMALGRNIELISYQSDGTEHHLTADIGGWDRAPVASDGVIADGTWGNVPSGETYIVPMESSAMGSIAINGSVPGLLLNASTEVVLHFDKGLLSRIEPEQSPTARWLYESEIDKARAKDDPNWSNLAEIGIGVNPGVSQLTGNMLYDEKAAGTAHVALGANRFLGGRIDSLIHCDMVVVHPSILIDGKPVMDQGRLSMDESAWRASYLAAHLQSKPDAAGVMLARSGIEANESPEGMLQRVLRSEPGRVSHCFVGDDVTARMAAALYARLPPDGDWISFRHLPPLAALTREASWRVVQVMLSYEVVRHRLPL